MKNSTENYAPGLSFEFEQSIHKMNAAIDAMNNAKEVEIKRMFPIIWERIKDLNIKDYEITDNLCNIETLINELLNK